MKPTMASKIALMQLFDGCSFPKSMSDAIRVLEGQKLTYHNNSIDIQLSPRKRAQARDMEQNISGIIHGIMYACANSEPSENKNG